MKENNHHSLPLAITINHIDWHLRNLDSGWETIKRIKKEDHINLHKKLNKVLKEREHDGFIRRAQKQEE